MGVVPSCTMGILGVHHRNCCDVVGETGTVGIRSHWLETPWTPYEVYTTKYSLSPAHYTSDKVIRCVNFIRCPRLFRPMGSNANQLVVSWCWGPNKVIQKIENTMNNTNATTQKRTNIFALIAFRPSWIVT